MRKSEIAGLPSIAYCSCLSGIEIKAIEDDIVYCTSGSWIGKQIPHAVKLYSSNNGGYFIINGHRIMLKDCIRVVV